MSKKTERSSNFELLRIVAMFMIIACHIAVHCVNGQLTDSSYMERFGTGYFNQPVFYKELFLLVICATVGNIANTIFVLISGYFVAATSKINLGKSGKKLLEQLFYSGIVLIFFSYIVKIVLSKTTYYIPLQNIQNINSMSWFIGYYFLIILIAAVFLNKKLEVMEQKNYRNFLIIVFALTQFSFSGNLTDNLADGLRTLLIGIFFFALGGYLRKYRPLANIKTFVLPLIIFVMYGIMYISYHNDVINNMQINGANAFFVQVIPGSSNYNPLNIVVAVCLFELFSRLRIRSNKVINFIAEGMLMIYLLHDNEFCYALWNTQDWITALWESPWGFLGKLAVWTCVTFLYGFGFYCFYVCSKKVLLKLIPFVLREESQNKINE